MQVNRAYINGVHFSWAWLGCSTEFSNFDSDMKGKRSEKEEDKEVSHVGVGIGKGHKRTGSIFLNIRTLQLMITYYHPLD